MQGLGYLPDKPDPRDFGLSRLGLGETFPSSASLAQFVPSVLNQGPIGSCVANALAQAIRIRALGMREDYPEIMSRLFAYWHSRNQHGDAKRDTGTYIRLAIKATNKLGRPPESAWPYVTSDHRNPVDGSNPPKFTRKPPPFVTMHAIDRRRQRFYRIASYDQERVTEIKRAISSGFPVVLGTRISESFLSLPANHVPVPIPTDRIVGGHAFLLAGYEEGHALACNSWGTGWGDRGWFRMSWEFVAWSQTHDLWAIDLPPR